MRLAREVPAAILVLLLLAAVMFFPWLRTDEAKDVQTLNGRVLENRIIRATDAAPASLALIVKTGDGGTVSLRGDSWNLADCNVGNEVQYRRTETKAGLFRYEIVQGSCRP